MSHLRGHHYGVSDEAFWGEFHYRPMAECDPGLAERLLEVFIDGFAEAALLRTPDRRAIRANVELEVGADASGHQAIQAGFLFSGHRPASEWDGTADNAAALVDDMARQIADSVSADPHEDDDWRDGFERRS